MTSRNPIWTVVLPAGADAILERAGELWRSEFGLRKFPWRKRDLVRGDGGYNSMVNRNPEFENSIERPLAAALSSEPRPAYLLYHSTGYYWIVRGEGSPEELTTPLRELSRRLQVPIWQPPSVEQRGLTVIRGLTPEQLRQYFPSQRIEPANNGYAIRSEPLRVPPLLPLEIAPLDAEAFVLTAESGTDTFTVQHYRGLQFLGVFQYPPSPGVAPYAIDGAVTPKAICERLGIDPALFGFV